ncbi:MAG: DUF6504 family protein [Actinomycetes bacterium]
MRCYDEPIHVRPGRVAGTAAPEQFLWRDRLWLVRSVQTRWAETRRRDGPACAVRGEDVAAETDLLGEHEIWRVVAANGRAGHPGVYELAYACGTGDWRLRACDD